MQAQPQPLLISKRGPLLGNSQDWNAHIQRAHPNLLSSGPTKADPRSLSPSVRGPPGPSERARTLPRQPKQGRQPEQGQGAGTRAEVKEEQGWQTVGGALMRTVNAQMQAANAVSNHAAHAVRSQPAAKRPAGGNAPAAAKKVKQQRQSTTPDVGVGSRADAQRCAPTASSVAEQTKHQTQRSAAVAPSFPPPTSASPHQRSEPRPSTLQQQVVCRSPPGTPAAAASTPGVTPEARLTCPVRGCKFVNGKCRTFANERVRSQPSASRLFTWHHALTRARD